jgi:uncharacterized protein (TIGR02001 family)
MQRRFAYPFGDLDMKKTLIAAAVAGALAVPGFALAQAAAEPASPHTLTANVGVVSDYLFRGISQTKGNPAIQGGVDYSHASGFYAGTWLSSISWVNDTQGGSTPTEIDVYGGYKNTFAEDFGYDVGLITYNYPGSGRDRSLYVSPDTYEVYGALSWKFLTLKYSHVISQNFVGWGVAGDSDTYSRGSNYIELNGVYDLGDGWGVSGHVGHQSVENNDGVNSPGGVDASYSDWNVGVTKDIGFGVVGLKYSDTNAKTCGDEGAAYCWAGYNAAKGRAVVSFTKTF